MLIDDKINSLQNLINKKVTYEDIAHALDMTGNALRNWVYRNRELKEFELKKIDNYFNVTTQNTTTKDSIILDYYPEVFGSCGNGYFMPNEEKQQIAVPVNALFKKLSKGKKYSVINADGSSMSPYIEAGDKLIIEHLNNQPIIDNHVYIFSYDNDLYIKRLYKNIDEVIAKSDNPDPIFKVKSIPKNEWDNLNIIGEVVGLMRYMR